MTDSTLNGAEKATQENNATSEEDKEKIVTYIANDFLSRSTLMDAFRAIPMNTLIEIVQNQSITRAKESVENLNEQEFNSLLEIVQRRTDESSEKNEGAK
jgi:hypothetical protein